jgi:phenylacetic acid degradation operon negative regulatory protein
MRKKLSWLGFGSPSSALYISPRDYQLEVVRLADEFDARPFVQVYRAESLVPADPAELVARAWPNLDLVNRRYAMFLQRFGRELTNARTLLTAGDLDDREAFKLRFQLGRAFRAQLFDDPELPSDLLPQNWNGAAARRLFLDHFSLLGPAAHHYVRTVCGIGDGSRRK